VTKKEKNEVLTPELPINVDAPLSQLLLTITHDKYRMISLVTRWAKEIKHRDQSNPNPRIFSPSPCVKFWERKSRWTSSKNSPPTESGEERFGIHFPDHQPERNPADDKEAADEPRRRERIVALSHGGLKRSYDCPRGVGKRGLVQSRGNCPAVDRGRGPGDRGVNGGAQEFVRPLTFTAITGRPALTDSFALPNGAMPHLDLAKNASAVLVAPASANLWPVGHGSGGRPANVHPPGHPCPCFLRPRHARTHVDPSRHPTECGNPERVWAPLLGADQRALASGDHGMGRLLDPEI
jgi:hypothetical protein